MIKRQKVLSAPSNNPKTGIASALLRRKYPKAAQAISDYGNLYQRQLKEALALEKEGKAIIIAPDDISGLKTLSSDLTALKSLYKKGYDDASAIIPFLDKSKKINP